MESFSSSKPGISEALTVSSPGRVSWNSGNPTYFFRRCWKMGTGAKGALENSSIVGWGLEKTVTL